ncbi:MAG: tRNA (adenosine(37)-N6)-threonylcarbamoyltransferase complex dimerization subunit type 1 TsaB [Pseudomonadota bacterium]
MILAFDTSGPYCSIAILSGDALLATRHVEMVKGQAERLMPLIEDTLAQAGADFADLTRIGVGTGPGNFTGIRISVSAARGLALARGIPALGVTLFEALRLEAPPRALASLPATKTSLYLAELTTQGISRPVQTTLEEMRPPADPSADGLTCIGHRADEIAAKFGLAVKPVALTPGEAIARVAAKMDTKDAPRPAPFYLRPADAAPPRDPAPVILDA